MAVVAVYAVLTVVLLLALIVILAQALFNSLLEFIRNVPTLREQLPAILQPWANRLAGARLRPGRPRRAGERLPRRARFGRPGPGRTAPGGRRREHRRGGQRPDRLLPVGLHGHRQRVDPHLPPAPRAPALRGRGAPAREHAIGRSFGGFLRGQAIIGLPLRRGRLRR